MIMIRKMNFHCLHYTHNIKSFHKNKCTFCEKTNHTSNKCLQVNDPTMKKKISEIKTVMFCLLVKVVIQQDDVNQSMHIRSITGNIVPIYVHFPKIKLVFLKLKTLKRNCKI